MSFLDAISKLENGIKASDWSLVEQAYKDISGKEINKSEIVNRASANVSPEHLFLKMTKTLHEAAISMVTGFSEEERQEVFENTKSKSSSFQLEDYVAEDEIDKAVPPDNPKIYENVPNTPPRPSTDRDMQCEKCGNKMSVSETEYNIFVEYDMKPQCMKCLS